MNPALPAPEKDGEAPALARRHCVLVVEDDFGVREALGLVLERAGYRVLTARDASEALAMLQGVRPNLILLDLGLPGMDGRKFRRRLLQNPVLAPIPVLVVSGADDAAREAAAMQVAGFLPKLADLATLLEAVRCHCA